jgi:hypothetical protein
MVSSVPLQELNNSIGDVYDQLLQLKIFVGFTSNPNKDVLELLLKEMGAKVANKIEDSDLVVLGKDIYII